jgi:hypothetical protein
VRGGDLSANPSLQNFMDATWPKLLKLHPTASLGIQAFLDKEMGLIVGRSVRDIVVDRQARRIMLFSKATRSSGEGGRDTVRFFALRHSS